MDRAGRPLRLAFRHRRRARGTSHLAEPPVRFEHLFRSSQQKLLSHDCFACPLAAGDFKTTRILRAVNVLLFAESGAPLSQLKPSADREIGFVVATVGKEAGITVTVKNDQFELEQR